MRRPFFLHGRRLRSSSLYLLETLLADLEDKPVILHSLKFCTCNETAIPEPIKKRSSQSTNTATTRNPERVSKPFPMSGTRPRPEKLYSQNSLIHEGWV
jgi:hypothetical protein